jgi:hypothetical protein
VPGVWFCAEPHARGSPRNKMPARLNLGW